MKQTTKQTANKRPAQRGLNITYVRKAAFIGKGRKETEHQREEREERGRNILNYRRTANRSKGGNFSRLLKARRKANKVARKSRSINRKAA